MVRENFINLFQKFNKDISLQENLWIEIKTYYSSDKRHYHNLSHLEKYFFEKYEIQARENLEKELEILTK